MSATLQAPPPAVIHRGRAIGLWSKKSTKRGLTVTFHPFDDGVAKIVRAGIESEAQKYARFIGHHGSTTVKIEQDPPISA